MDIKQAMVTTSNRLKADEGYALNWVTILSMTIKDVYGNVPDTDKTALLFLERIFDFQPTDSLLNLLDKSK